LTFDYPGYTLNFIQKTKCNDKSDHLFSIVYKFHSPITKYNYIINAEYHKQDIFAIKFYCVKDKRSKYKYNKIVNKGDIGNIMITCAKVIPLLINDYPAASFGFCGARTVDLKSRKAESYSNNQRFRIYKKIVSLKFGTKTFTHYEYDEISSYLLVNNLVDVILSEKKIKNMFRQTYNNLPDL
tara:strand:- start:258 stop:806 length:549 start_codon:yes stop_codon:yes gene_type:complete